MLSFSKNGTTVDKDWVDQQIVYDLIAAMVEVVKEFQSSFQGVKIILALRDNLHQLILTGREHRGGQREKYSAMYLNLSWGRDMLSDLLAARIKEVSHGQMSINTLFEASMKNEGFSYIIERTYYRPRDIISYVNKIIEQADNKSHFTRSIIKKAEPYYSTERMHALEDEWEENYGRITKICHFLTGVHNGFNVKNIRDDSFSDLYLSEDYLDNFKGKLREIGEDWRLDWKELNNIHYFQTDDSFRIYLNKVFALPLKKFQDANGWNIKTEEMKKDIKKLLP